MSALARRSWPTMGTQVSLMMAESAGIDEAARIAADVLSTLDQRFSSYRRDSELRRFDAGELESPSRDLRHVLAACAWLTEVSDGVFTTAAGTTTRGTIDVAGYVKGWAVDRAADGLELAGIGDYCLGVGGDWRCQGRHPDGRPWRMAVLDPHDTGRARALASVGTNAIATSGTYERGNHLVAPRQSDPTVATRAPDTASFTVVGPRLAWADAFATVGFLLGDDGLTWVAQFAHYHAAVIRNDGTMVADSDFPLAPGTVPHFAPPAALAPPTGWRDITSSFLGSAVPYGQLDYAGPAAARP